MRQRNRLADVAGKWASGLGPRGRDLQYENAKRGRAAFVTDHKFWPTGRGPFPGFSSLGKYPLAMDNLFRLAQPHTRQCSSAWDNRAGGERAFMNQPPTPVATPQQLEQIALRAAQTIRPGQCIGLGSGRAAHAFVRALGQRIHTDSLDIVGIPTSDATAHVAYDSGVPLGTLDKITALDLAVDGADEVDPNLNLLKGGGGDLLREKLIASMAARIIILVGQEKLVPRLGAKFPVFLEVVAFALPVVSRKLTAMGATVQTRRRPDQSVFLTDNGNPILHAVFGPPPHHLSDPEELDRQLHHIPGIIETGIFLNMAHEILVANFDGSIEHRRRSPA